MKDNNSEEPLFLLFSKLMNDKIETDIIYFILNNYSNEEIINKLIDYKLLKVDDDKI